MSRRQRLDAELVRRRLVLSRTEAGRSIEAGLVLVNGSVADKASRLVDPGDAVVVQSPPARFVSRGGADPRGPGGEHPRRRRLSPCPSPTRARRPRKPAPSPPDPRPGLDHEARRGEQPFPPSCRAVLHVPACPGHGHRQRHARQLLRRRPTSSTRRRRSPTPARSPRRAPTSSTSAASRPGPGAAARLARRGDRPRRAGDRGARAPSGRCRSRSTPASRGRRAPPSHAGADIVNDVTALAGDPTMPRRRPPTRGAGGRADAHAGRARDDAGRARLRRRRRSRSATSSPRASPPARPPASRASASSSIPASASARPPAHNLALIRGLPLLHDTGCALLFGASRKRFIGAIGGAPDPDDRLAGSLAGALSGARRTGRSPRPAVGKPARVFAGPDPGTPSGQPRTGRLVRDGPMLRRKG